LKRHLVFTKNVFFNNFFKQDDAVESVLQQLLQQVDAVPLNAPHCLQSIGNSAAYGPASAIPGVRRQSWLCALFSVWAAQLALRGFSLISSGKTFVLVRSVGNQVCMMHFGMYVWPPCIRDHVYMNACMYVYR